MENSEDKSNNYKILSLKLNITQWRTTIDAMSEVVFLIDMDHKILLCNNATLEFLGISDFNEIIGHKCWELVHGTNQLVDWCPMSQMRTSGHKETSIKNLDGKWLEISVDPVFGDTEGQLIGAVHIITDITTKKQAEDALRESEQKYRALFDNSPFAVGLVDMTGKIIDVNRAHEVGAGYSKKDLIGKPFTELSAIPERYLPIVAKGFKNLIKNGTSEPQEIQVYNKDGSLIWIYLYASLIKLGDKVIIQVISQNITTIKEAEQELKKLNKIKSELLRRTSHELKTPLVSIKGFSSLLLELYSDKLDDYILSTIGEINQGCVRLENLIRDILKTAELDTKSVQLKKTEEDLSFLIRFCVNELRGFIKLRNHSVDLQIHEELISNFEKEQIHQVLSNLITNAIKYTPINGRIDIKSEIQDNSFLVSIKDNGIGFTKEEKGRLFEQFGKIERYGQGLNIVSDGSGLGLYISKKIVELHGGKIWVESEGRNKGSTFYFTLPINIEQNK